MGLFNRFKNFIFGSPKPKKEKDVKRKPQDRTYVQKTKQKKNIFSELKNLFKPKKTETKKTETKKNETKKTETKKKYNINTSKSGYSLFNNAKKAKFDLIGDISAKVKIVTNTGIIYRYWSINSENKKISNKEIINQIEEDIYLHNNIFEIISESGNSFTIDSFSIVQVYK